MSNWNKRKIDKERLSIDENFTMPMYDENRNNRSKFPNPQNIVRLSLHHDHSTILWHIPPATGL